MERDAASVDDALRSFITEHELRVRWALCRRQKVTGCELSDEMN
jgi:hypothetical protein